MELNITHNIDCKQGIKELPENSIHCSVSSPPYWALRDYGVNGQLGQEETPELFIENLVFVYDEIYRVLRSDGVCFVNLGDTYGTGSGGDSFAGKKQQTNKGSLVARKQLIGMNKSLLMIPYRFAWAMVQRGWILRNIINWNKPNQMPQSVKDRFTVDFEPIFMFTKSTKYYFEQQLEPYEKPMNRWGGEKLEANGKSEWDNGTKQTTYRKRNMRPNPEGRNMRTTWNINTKPYSEAHFAVYPEKLVKRMILSGCPENGIVLDPFHGSGTTGIVAKKLNRNFIGYELNPDYIKLSKKRYDNELGMFG